MTSARRVRYGIYLPLFGDYSNPRTLVELARDAEAAGWDGVFVWDHILGVKNASLPVADPWISLAAIAVNTEFIRLGPLVTPLARRRPWKVAREAISLDHLSGGRLVLGVGLGYPADADFEAFGEVSEDKVRAKKLDASLEIVTGLWTGKPYGHRSEYYQIEETVFLPPPVQSPRIPIWVAGLWPNKAPFRRAARWDGVVPMKVGSGLDAMSPEDLCHVVAYVRQHRVGPADFDVVLAGCTPGDDPARAADLVHAYLEAGLTWWLESLHAWRGSFQDTQRRIRQGPPKI